MLCFSGAKGAVYGGGIQQNGKNVGNLTLTKAARTEEERGSETAAL